ncbi:DNA polymerase III subunit beta [Sporosarcina sp. Marseille-Q4063]|uniref:DNA polymerase III subunit beta n=1 Tax=Sporosarcina sp. Marseille-Q4063 TaxID=2810514 RepID=UPI001BAF8E64|nr:DNA polymerase III subunit beta [Sporosarcina sp. Marseille-Q4063]QUW21996.1 DNA polymerase III subunit beta [Sporosarcina sp. Marseille-Q4063]
MEFTVNYSLFASAVSEINKVVSSKSVIPILSGIKIETNQNGLKLTGSNSDIILERTIPLHIEGKAVVQISEYGGTVVLSKYLNEIVKKLPKDICIKTAHNDSITLKSGDIETKLKGFKSSDFPKVPEMNHDKFVKVPFGKLTKAINQTAFAVSKSESKPILTGVKLEFGNKKLSCTATDSHRLARQEIHIDTEVQESFVVPSTSLSELINLKESDSAIVDIYYTNNFIAFKTVNRILYSRLIDGIYPNAQSLIPIEPKSIVTLETQLLIDGIARACVFSTEWKYNNVQLEIVDDATIKISSNSTEVGMIEEFQKTLKFDGESDIRMSFDGRTVLDALKRIPEEHVTISLFGSMKPIVIKPRESSNCFHLISPVRTN